MTPKTVDRRSRPGLALSLGCNAYMPVKTWALHNSQKVGTTQVSINWWMAKQNVLYPLILYSAIKRTECLTHATTREKAMAPHSNTLAWKIPWTEEPGRLKSTRSLNWTQLSNFTFIFHFHALEKAMATHSSVLAWRIPGTGEPGGLPSLGSHRVGHAWSDLAAAATT